MAAKNDLLAHLSDGPTTVARCWAVVRADGAALGFTDHDLPLSFGGIAFEPDSGLAARSLQQGTGLAVDNSEAVGILSHEAIREEDLRAGRYDGAEVCAWLVNWQRPEEHALQFRGTIGEVRMRDGVFTAELRGMTEALNQPRGRAFQRTCGAVLGDAQCRVNLDAAVHRFDGPLAAVGEEVTVSLGPLTGYAAGWFSRGEMRVLDGVAAGLTLAIKEDRGLGAARTLELWSAPGIPLSIGDRVSVVAGCDKTANTCREKFNNFLRFRGFPDIPGEDWLISYPIRAGRNDGGALT